MHDPSEVIERLHAERESITTGDVDAGLQRVESMCRQRRRRRLAVGGASAIVVVVAVGAALAAVGGQRSDLVVTDNFPAETTPGTTLAPTSPPTTMTEVDSTSEDEPSQTSVPGDDDVGVDDTDDREVGATIVGTAVAGDPVDMTDTLRRAGGDVSFQFAVPWQDGFLVGSLAGSGWDALSSTDGHTWERTSVAPVSEAFWSASITSTNDRLVASGVRPDGNHRMPQIAFTTDLTNWAVQAIPVDWTTPLPSAVQIGGPPPVAANATGWIAVVNTWATVDWPAVAELRLGREVPGTSVAYSDEGVRITVDENAESLSISWAELADEWGAEVVELVRGIPAAEVWTGSWDAATAPVRHDLPVSPSGAWVSGPLIATDDGFVIVRTGQQSVGDELPEEVVELVAGWPGVDGSLAWSVLDAPDDVRVRSGFALDGDLGVIAEDGAGRLAVYRVGNADQRWTSVEVPELPRTARYIETFPTGAIVLDTAAPDQITTSTTLTFEQNGLRLTWIYDAPNSTYAVTEIETGDVVVSESIDLREVEGSFELAFEHLNGGLGRTIITDPLTGAVLMDISAADMESAMQAATEQLPEPEPPDPWLLGSSDGVAWYSRALPTGDAPQSIASNAVVSGDALVVQTSSNEWFTIELDSR